MGFINWLFNTGTGVAVLVFGGMLLFIVIAFVAERKTHKMYYNHEPEDDDDDWEDDDGDWEDDADEDEDDD
jgi:hypothetical protein